MQRSASPSSVPHATGWDLPEEILHVIMRFIEFPEEDEYQTWDKTVRSRRALVAPSLVNRYWSAAIRPLLFRSLGLRNLEDTLFLQDIVRSPTFATSGLATAIERIYVYYPPPPAAHWVHHVQWLMPRLPQTSFFWYPRNASGAAAAAARSALVDPFAVLPRVPSSFLRIAVLVLQDVRLASCARLVRLVDGIASLHTFLGRNLSFADPAPYVQPPWRRRLSALQRPLRHCRIALEGIALEGIALAAQTALAADILRVPGRLGLVDGAWESVLRALVPLVSDTSKQVTLGLYQRAGSQCDHAAIGFSDTVKSPLDDPTVTAEVHILVGRRDASQQPTEPAEPAYIRRIVLTGSFPGLYTTGPTSLDALHSENAAAVQRLEELVVRARVGNWDDQVGMKTILCAVLRRSQLSWALDSRRLVFVGHLDKKPRDYLFSKEILSVRAEHVIDDKHLTLDIPEQAEWLLRFTFGRRKAYLRQLVAQRAMVPVLADNLAPAASSSAARRIYDVLFPVLPERNDQDFGHAPIRFKRGKRHVVDFPWLPALPANPEPTAKPPHAPIRAVVFTGAFADTGDTAPALPGSTVGTDGAGEEPVDESCIAELVLCARRWEPGEFAGMQRILCAVLRRTQLAWALDAGALRVVLRHALGGDLVGSAGLRAMPASWTVDGTALTLDVPEQAELLLCLTPAEEQACLRRFAARRQWAQALQSAGARSAAP